MFPFTFIGFNISYSVCPGDQESAGNGLVYLHSISIIEASFNTSDSNSIGVDCFLRKFEGIHCTGLRGNGGYSLTGCIFPMDKY
jgi:hypothetical protein